MLLLSIQPGVSRYHYYLQKILCIKDISKNVCDQLIILERTLLLIYFLNHDWSYLGWGRYGGRLERRNIFFFPLKEAILK